MKYDVVVTTLCQHRPARLRKTLNHVLKEWERPGGVSAFVGLVPDRPTRKVEDVVAQYEGHSRVHVLEPSLPIMSPEHGQQWISARNEALAAFDQPGHTADWQMNMDDDWILGPNWDQHLRACLTSPDVGNWRAISLALFVNEFGEPQVNLRQHHDSPLIGRYQTGWRFDPALCNQITKEADSLGNQRDLPFFLLDTGTLTTRERQQLYKDYAACGKLDPYTRAYVKDPLPWPLKNIYKRFPEPRKFYEWQLKKIGLLHAG